MAKTGLELNDHTVGEAAALKDETSYPVDVAKMTVVLQYGPYVVAPINEEDNGKRFVTKTVKLTKADFSGLTVVQRQALLALVESKI